MIGVGRWGCSPLTSISVRHLARRHFLERDRQIVLGDRVDHRGRELLEGALAEVVVVRVDLTRALGGDDHARVRRIDVLEQAVYAGRNHTAILAVAFATLAMLAPAARADDVAQ